MGWRSAFTVALLLVALITTWNAWQGGSDPTPAPSTTVQRSDYVLHQFDLVILNAQGDESLSLSAPQLRQTPGARTLELTAPKILIPRNGVHDWEVNAHSGWVSANSDEVRLRGGVVATPLNDASGQTRIVTEALDIFPQQELATSEAIVTLTRPGATMHGIGMRAYLDQNRVELLSKVHIRHDPFSR